MFRSIIPIGLMLLNCVNSEERNLVEKISNEFQATQTCPTPEIASFLAVEQWIRVALYFLEAAHAKACAMEMACVLWETFQLDQERLKALKEHPQLLVLLQACVHASDSEDWSFLDRFVVPAFAHLLDVYPISTQRCALVDANSIETESSSRCKALMHPRNRLNSSCLRSSEMVHMVLCTLPSARTTDKRLQ